jgi:uncharacterized protein
MRSSPSRSIRRFVSLLALLTPLAAGSVARAELNVPDPGTFVVDNANLLEPAIKQELEARLKELEQKTTAQVKLLTVPTTDGEDIFTFAQRHYHNWKLGQKKDKNGALIVLALDAAGKHEVRVHTGNGLEGALPDSWIGTTTRQIVNQYFRGGQYSAGLRELTFAVSDKVAAEYHQQLTGQPALRRNWSERHPVMPMILFWVVVIIIVAMASRRSRGGRYWSGGGGGMWQGAYWGSVLGDVFNSSSGGGGGWGGSGGDWGGGGGSFGGGGDSAGGGGGASW